MTETSLLQTVDENLKNYTKRQRKDIKKARTLYERMMFPSQDSFSNTVNHNSLKNCPIDGVAAKHMDQVYSRNVHAIKGKTTRQSHRRVESAIVPVPPHILQAHSDVTLCIDLFYVDGLTFLLTVSRNIHKVTVTSLERRTLQTHVLPALRNVVNKYLARGFSVPFIHCDNEFAPLGDTLRLSWMPL